MIARTDNVFMVSGPLTIDSAKVHQRFPFEQGRSGEQMVVNLAQVEVVDSAAVSLMLSWMRQAKAMNLELSFIHAPTNLRSLVDLYGLSEVLPLNYS
ncbi:MAG: STAS domain-containing protein [Gallionella sp.]|nr:STAS domain-containing protein [Gallionella sp.]